MFWTLRRPGAGTEASLQFRRGSTASYLTVTRVLAPVAEKYTPSLGEYQRQ